MNLHVKNIAANKYAAIKISEPFDATIPYANNPVPIVSKINIIVKSPNVFGAGRFSIFYSGSSTSN